MLLLLSLVLMMISFLMMWSIGFTFMIRSIAFSGSSELLAVVYVDGYSLFIAEFILNNAVIIKCLLVAAGLLFTAGHLKMLLWICYVLKTI
ncbi:hypothetical protein L1987_01587 [Smallanthus sonchifolius]|uniref:Uncharacterized protein n=1 Tax=Smallanthus sonchifolius TaxID=185202 RepID=A0ACB9K5P8_9ASTR|nr:hypothetical protein L1987_01587 [Smallanthus sonchifolius]